ncbi:MAG TPA: LuxR C-terminal-related transcriptional regulator [Ktedonobacteraceae bacterium]|nr:LuxR C-terminal-related transcriptional regulator [Ktedonobacteraceae bacterium]
MPKNDTMAAIQCGLHGGMLAQAAAHIPVAINIMGIVAYCMIGAGRLHEARRLTQQAMQLGRQQGGLVLPDVGWPAVFQAEILCEWNQLDKALSLVEEAISQCEQTVSTVSLFPQQSKPHQSQPKRAGKHFTTASTRSLPDPLTERELEVLRLLTRGASNLEIAQELAIVVNTVKRHVSQIFSKLGVKNRVQAVRQARALGLLGEEF